MLLREKFLQAKIWDEGCRVYDSSWLMGQWWSNRSVFQESCAQPKVAILHLCGGFSFYRRTRRHCSYMFLEEEPVLRHSCTIASWLLLFLLPFLPDKHLFESALWNSGKTREAEWNLLTTNKRWETQKRFVSGRAPQSHALFHNLYYFLPSACFGFSLPPAPLLVLFLVSKGRKLLFVILLFFF